MTFQFPCFRADRLKALAQRVQYLERVVERLLVHRQARMLGAPEAIDHLRPRRRRFDPDDVHPRHHDLVHLGLREGEDSVNQLLLGGETVAYLRRFGETGCGEVLR